MNLFAIVQLLLSHKESFICKERKRSQQKGDVLIEVKHKELSSKPYIVYKQTIYSLEVSYIHSIKETKGKR